MTRRPRLHKGVRHERPLQTKQPRRDSRSAQRPWLVGGRGSPPDDNRATRPLPSDDAFDSADELDRVRSSRACGDGRDNRSSTSRYFARSSNAVHHDLSMPQLYEAYCRGGNFAGRLHRAIRQELGSRIPRRGDRGRSCTNSDRASIVRAIRRNRPATVPSAIRDGGAKGQGRSTR